MSAQETQGPGVPTTMRKTERTRIDTRDACPTRARKTVVIFFSRPENPPRARDNRDRAPVVLRDVNVIIITIIRTILFFCAFILFFSFLFAFVALFCRTPFARGTVDHCLRSLQLAPELLNHHVSFSEPRTYVLLSFFYFSFFFPPFLTYLRPTSSSLLYIHYVYVLCTYCYSDHVCTK